MASTQIYNSICFHLKWPWCSLHVLDALIFYEVSLQNCNECQQIWSGIMKQKLLDCISPCRVYFPNHEAAIDSNTAISVFAVHERDQFATSSLSQCKSDNHWHGSYELEAWALQKGCALSLEPLPLGCSKVNSFLGSLGVRALALFSLTCTKKMLSKNFDGTQGNHIIFSGTKRTLLQKQFIATS